MWRLLAKRRGWKAAWDCEGGYLVVWQVHYTGSEAWRDACRHPRNFPVLGAHNDWGDETAHRVDRPWLRFFHRNETWMTGAAILGTVAAITFVMAAVLL